MIWFGWKKKVGVVVLKSSLSFLGGSCCMQCKALMQESMVKDGIALKEVKYQWTDVFVFSVRNKQFNYIYKFWTGGHSWNSLE